MPYEDNDPKTLYMEVFISHSSKDDVAAQKIQQLLSDVNLTSWLDQSHIRLGVLLRKELQMAIRKSKAIVLIWSKHAAKSRWVAAEIMTAFHLKRKIIAYVCDRSPLPYFLQNGVYLTSQVPAAKARELLRHSIVQVRKTANEVILTQPSRTLDQQAVVSKLVEGQQKLLSLMLKSDTQKTIDLQEALENMQKIALKTWKYDATLLNLAGYHYKNAYTLKHWDALQAGRPPKDRLLEKAERYFFESLFVNPYDYSALNGLGSILIYEREYEAAEFFVQRAIDLAEKDGVVYHQALYDLDLIRRISKRAPV